MAMSLVCNRLLRSNTRIMKNHYRNGYIVLLPESAQPPSAEPLPLKESGLPDISSLTTEKCVSMIGQHTLEFESGLWHIEEKLKGQEITSSNLFSDVLDPLEKLSFSLDNVWGLMKTLYLTNATLMPQEYYMSIHDRARRARSLKFNSRRIYSACKEVNTDTFSNEQKRIVGKFRLEGRLNGLDLSLSQQTTLKSLLNKINQEKTKFRQKVQISTNKFTHTVVDSNIMRDFPESLLKAMANDKSQYNRGPWTVTLQPHICHQFMEYCPHRDLRWNVWQANVLRSSTYGDSSCETSTHIEELRNLRKSLAKLLGFESFAHMSMETKMAGNVETVQHILARLLKKAFKAQQKEMKALQEFAESRGFEGSLDLWDIPYWKRKQMKTHYSYDEQELQQYFPLPRVLDGLMNLCRYLFGIEIIERKAENTWHPDVRCFDVFDADSNNHISSFFFDPYAREGQKRVTKEESGWMIGLSNKSRDAQKPLAALIFNFEPPTDGKPCLLTFSDVQQLFKKFGHALQHLLTTVSYSEISGLSNIEWDAVEVCSNLFTYWLYHKETVRNISGHYETNEPLPEDNLSKLEQIQHLLAGYNLCQQLYLSSLDLKLHTTKDFWLDVVRELWPQHFVLPLHKYDAHPCSFTAIFSDEWASAYYCHIWSQIVAADVFSAFQEVGLENTSELSKVGARFRSTFLSLGGSCHPSEVFRRFRGRDPSPNALLWSLGLKKIPNETLV